MHTQVPGSRGWGRYFPRIAMAMLGKFQPRGRLCAHGTGEPGVGQRMWTLGSQGRGRSFPCVTMSKQRKLPPGWRVRAGAGETESGQKLECVQ